MLGTIVQQKPTDTSVAKPVKFTPNLSGPRQPRKRTKRTASAAQLGSITLMLDMLEPVDLIGDPEDSGSLAYWRTKDIKTGGQVINRFCHELHEYVADACCERSLSGVPSQRIQTMLEAAELWYLNHLESDQEYGKLGCTYTFIFNGPMPL